MKQINDLFKDLALVSKIQKKLPTLFQLAEKENSRDGKLGMEIGSTRERIIIALLLYQFGEKNVMTNIPITEKETDVFLFKKPISIKTVTNKKIVGVKLIWTVDGQKSLEFINSYKAECDLLFIHINWNSEGVFYLISREAQAEILSQHGKDFYFKLPKKGTNPRGVEITNQAFKELIKHHETKRIRINWVRNKQQDYNPYGRWVDLWENKKTFNS